MSKPKNPFDAIDRLKKAGAKLVYAPEQKKLIDHFGMEPEKYGFEQGASLTEVAEDPEAYMICSVYQEGEEMILPDNKIATCFFGCGATLQHRPTVPDDMRKICIACALDRAESRE